MAFRQGVLDKNVYGTQGADEIFVVGKAAGYGLHGDDFLYGDDQANKLSGQQGEDWLDGGAGNDALFGGDATDFLFGQEGNDMMWGDEGNDYLHGGEGDDKLRGGNGDDIIEAGVGKNHIDAGNGDDMLIHTPDSASVYKGGNGFDDLEFRPTDPYEEGNDIFVFDLVVDNKGIAYFGESSATGIERFHLGSLSEGKAISYQGGNLDLVVEGGSGNDSFLGGSGNDTLLGGAGADDYSFLASSKTMGHDIITGFSADEGDTLSIQYTNPTENSMIYQQIEDAGSTRFYGYYGEKLVHILDVVDVVGITPINSSNIDIA